jgi:hypothetical protein
VGLPRLFSVTSPSRNFLRKVLVGEISLPVVRVEGSQKAATGICTNDLAAYLDKQADAARVDQPEPRLQAARHYNLVRSARSRHRKDHRGAFKAPPPRRSPGFDP